ncbi:SDR family NAD(P)-dependent oxidoreductase [Caldimonas sp. KR1-144]|uniref:SDR family NAD(P)-dependent oxidoreductase n=1 Tax=Caldimonas sp. KR1-144 TaxID=3400911 RepID=UPI003C0C54CC
MERHLYVITGASRGLGHALATQLLRPGHELLLIARRPATDLATLAASRGATVTDWAIDLAQEPAGAASRLAEWLRARGGAGLRSANLINNAAALPTSAPLGEVPAAEVSQALRVGLEAAMLLTGAFLAATRDWTATRRIVNVSSGLGRRPMASAAVYCAAKAGMDHFSRCVALEEAARPHGARIVSLAPGVIDTDMQVQLRSADPAAFADRERFVRLKTDGLLDSPEQAAAKLLAFLAKPDFGREPVADVRDA